MAQFEQSLMPAISIVTLVAMLIGLVISIRTIKKQELEIKHLQWQLDLERSQIVRPSLDEIISFRGDAGEFYEYLQHRRTLLSGAFNVIPWFTHVVGSFTMSVDFKLPRTVLVKLEKARTELIVFSLGTCLVLVFVIYLLSPLPEGVKLWSPIPLPAFDETPVPAWVTTLFVTLVLAYMLIVLFAFFLDWAIGSWIGRGKH